MGRVTQPPQLVDGFIVEGDLAYLPEEWERVEYRRAYWREWRRRRRQDPAFREREMELQRQRRAA